MGPVIPKMSNKRKADDMEPQQDTNFNQYTHIKTKQSRLIEFSNQTSDWSQPVSNIQAANSLAVLQAVNDRGKQTLFDSLQCVDRSREGEQTTLTVQSISDKILGDKSRDTPSCSAQQQKSKKYKLVSNKTSSSQLQVKLF